MKKKSKYDYDVNKDKKEGTDNKAFKAEEGKSGNMSSNVAAGTNTKWVNNYVPFGDFPDGSACGAVDEVDRVAVVNEAGGSKNGESKWQKNYVPYKEDGEEDSNKRASD